MDGRSLFLGPSIQHLKIIDFDVSDVPMDRSRPVDSSKATKSGRLALGFEETVTFCTDHLFVASRSRSILIRVENGTI